MLIRMKKYTEFRREQHKNSSKGVFQVRKFRVKEFRERGKIHVEKTCCDCTSKLYAAVWYLRIKLISIRHHIDCGAKIRSNAQYRKSHLTCRSHFKNWAGENFTLKDMHMHRRKFI